MICANGSLISCSLVSSHLTFTMARFIIWSLLAIHFILAANAGENSLESVGSCINRDKITLSGFSSGGSFAQMLQFAYSSMFSGIAVFSHTYYRCGPPNGNITQYDMFCTKLFYQNESKWYDPELVHKDIKNYETRGLIDHTSNLRNKRLYVYTGLRNTLFKPKQSLAIVGIYERYLGSLSTVFTRVQDSNLVLPTFNKGGKCTDADEDQFFIANCKFSGVTEAINFLLFPNKLYEAYQPPQSQAPPRLLTFDQTEFSDGPDSMDDTGYYYIPDSCRGSQGVNRKCYLHLYFHGCLSGREFAGGRHIENSGLLDVAREKRIIMVFPQVKSIKENQINEIGCWDTFGIFGENYATKKGAQIRAVKKMLDKLLRSNGPARPNGSSSNYHSKGNGLMEALLRLLISLYMSTALLT